MGVMTMGNNVPRSGLKPTFLAFWASMLPFHHIGSLTSLLYPCPHVYVALLHQRSVQSTTKLYIPMSYVYNINE